MKKVGLLTAKEFTLRYFQSLRRTRILMGLGILACIVLMLIYDWDFLIVKGILIFLIISYFYEDINSFLLLRKK